MTVQFTHSRKDLYRFVGADTAVARAGLELALSLFRPETADDSTLDGPLLEGLKKPFVADELESTHFKILDDLASKAIGRLLRGEPPAKEDPADLLRFMQLIRYRHPRFMAEQTARRGRKYSRLRHSPSFYDDAIATLGLPPGTSPRELYAGFANNIYLVGLVQAIHRRPSFLDSIGSSLIVLQAPQNTPFVLGDNPCRAVHERVSPGALLMQAPGLKHADTLTLLPISPTLCLAAVRRPVGGPMPKVNLMPEDVHRINAWQILSADAHIVVSRPSFSLQQLPIRVDQLLSVPVQA